MGNTRGSLFSNSSLSRLFHYSANQHGESLGFRLVLHLARTYLLLLISQNRGVNASPNTKNPPDYPFKAIPEPYCIHHRIYDIGEHAVMTVLGVGMVASVVTRGLEQPDAME